MLDSSHGATVSSTLWYNWALSTEQPCWCEMETKLRRFVAKKEIRCQTPLGLKTHLVWPSLLFFVAQWKRKTKSPPSR